MKKKIREQLKMLANQILQEEQTFNVSTIRKSVGELQEKLTILEYLENQLDDTQEPEFEESLDSKSFREENWFVEPEPVPQPEHKEDLIEPLMEKIKDIVAQMPEESDAIDEMLEEMLPAQDKEPKLPRETPKKTKNELEEFAANYQQMPEFERKNPELFPPSNEVKTASHNFKESKPKSLNDTIKRGLNIGLNDRLAFIKHLFEGQAEDYTRVLSQINTMENFEEAQNFIHTNVKPDYNNWLSKEEYSSRFMSIVEKSFN
ncbi:hypothetical protein EI546_12245 [Aequorivita sp. H23M31]|uniref:Uncharacterized protein n=1 Tax=Aequorivita ciconiae TaxID=2494375 RepID=A0A410G5A6_9FLAO|nr:hypothetical protein [Aequorivita sp. H23M31]QAA82443.1 hypothetical protein EI546_12245 [Aequorivita sp. H23M31]